MTEIGKVPGLEEMADRLAITEVIHAYARGVDRASTELMKATCWPDSTLDYGGYKGEAYSFLENLPAGLKRFRNTQHQISNTLIELDGDEARSECYLTAHHYLPVEDGPNSEMTYIGRYLDHMQKRDGVWKIKHRKIVMTWHQNAETTEDFDNNEALVQISRASHEDDDPSYAFFGGSND
jgi:hypothetical protein